MVSISKLFVAPVVTFTVAGKGAQVVEELTEPAHLVAIGVALSGGLGQRLA